MKRLHFGCGQNKLNGWVNADILYGSEFVFDLTQNWPFLDEEFDFVYSEHVLEHFGPEQGRFVLSEAYRVLKSGGVMRIAMPCLDNLISWYSKTKNREWESGQEWIQKFGYNGVFDTSCDMFNAAVRDWGHKYIYNKEKIKTIFPTAVFKQIGESDFEDLRNLETRADSALIFEVKK